MPVVDPEPVVTALPQAGRDQALRVLEAARSAGEKGYATIDRELGALNGRARPLRAVESERLPAIWRGVE